MKLILTGATGFIGQEVLSQALSRPSITTLITLTRKPLPAPYDTATYPKLHPIIVEDFSSYTPFVLSQLSGADACIWELGSVSRDLEIQTKTRKVFPMAAARALAALAKEEGRKFRFVYGSGIITVRDQERTTFLAPTLRKVGGQAELDLLAFGEENSENFEVFVTRPASVLRKEPSLLTTVRGYLPYSIRVESLANALIDIAENGAKMKTLEHADLSERAKQVAGM